MMPKSFLCGRRIQITGSISTDQAIASKEEVEIARAFLSDLVAQIVRRGATFVVPVDAEKKREDGQPICFDWLVWQAIRDNILRRPADGKNPLAVAVQHHKSESQIPAEFASLWGEMRNSDAVSIENVSHWDMNSKRMEVQAKQGDILITLGGTEGVLFLANLYHEAGKHVVPLNFALTPDGYGSLRLFSMGLSSAQADRLFRTSSLNPHTWMNRINWTKTKPVSDRVEGVLDLLEALEPPRAFAVRLLTPSHTDFSDVQTFFDAIVQPVVETEMRYKLVVVDGARPFEHARMDQEIFVKLHRSSVVLADITGARPNCFIELGYALGRGLPTMLTVKEGAEHPFDIYSLAALHWKTTGSLEERKGAFRKHWEAIKNRPTLVPSDPLVW